MGATVPSVSSSPCCLFGVMWAHKKRLPNFGSLLPKVVILIGNSTSVGQTTRWLTPFRIGVELFYCIDLQTVVK